jgi:hypothetical protein
MAAATIARFVEHATVTGGAFVLLLRRVRAVGVHGCQPTTKPAVEHRATG